MTSDASRKAVCTASRQPEVQLAVRIRNALLVFTHRIGEGALCEVEAFKGISVS